MKVTVKSIVRLSNVLIIQAALFSNSAMALSFSLDIEPIIGFERNQKLVPTPHTKERTVYGARAALGIPLLKLEAEFTRGSDTEIFSEPAMTTKDSDDKLKIGAKSTFRLSNLLSLIFRGGVQAKQNTHEETTAAGTSKEISKITYKPYAGGALSAGLGKKFQITGGLTVVFNKFPDMKLNDYQTTLGFTVKLP